MNASRLFDTNILLYAYDLDASPKRARALRLVEQGWTALGDTAVSVQDGQNYGGVRVVNPFL